MDNLPHRAMLARLAEFRHELVLQLVLRRGDNYDAIARLRERRGITPPKEVPPLPPTGCYHDPPLTVGSRRRQRGPLDRNAPGEGWKRREGLKEAAAKTHKEWIEGIPRPRPSMCSYHDLPWPGQLECLFLEVVPEHLRLGVISGYLDPWGVYRRERFHGHGGDKFHRSPWATFLSACVLYDPPRHDLERFADHVDFDVGPRVPPEEEPDLPPVHLPIRHMRDPDRLEADLNWYWGSVIAILGEALADEVPQSRFVDLVDAIKSLQHPEFTERMVANRPTPYLDTAQLDSTTREDIRAAIEVIRNGGKAPKSHRAKRDRLRDVQVAILKADGWDLPAIGRRFGWKPRKDIYGKLRLCEPARLAAEKGREILAAHPDALYQIPE